MKTNIIISIKDFIDIKDKKLIFSFLSIFAGLVLGVITYAMSGSACNSILEIFLRFNGDFSDKSNLEVLSGIILSGLPYFVVMFILGGSVFGKSLCVIITSIKTMGISALTSYFYIQLGLKGLEYALLVFFPGKCVLMFAMLFMTRICIEMSEEITSSTKIIQLKGYFIKSIASLFIFIISWIIDFVCILIFSDLFSF